PSWPRGRVLPLAAWVAVRRLAPGLGVLSPAVLPVVAPQHRVLGALLVDEHDVDDDPSFVRPGEALSRPAVADEISRTHAIGDHSATIGARGRADALGLCHRTAGGGRGCDRARG